MLDILSRALLLRVGPKAFPISLRCLWLLMLRVLTQCSYERLVW
jgi:hypothetical protein